jgi:hypothetical protein
VKGDPAYSELCNEYVEALEANPPDRVVVHSVSLHLRSQQAFLNYVLTGVRPYEREAEQKAKREAKE